MLRLLVVNSRGEAVLARVKNGIHSAREPFASLSLGKHHLGEATARLPIEIDRREIEARHAGELTLGIGRGYQPGADLFQNGELVGGGHGWPKKSRPSKWFVLSPGGAARPSPRRKPKRLS